MIKPIIRDMLFLAQKSEEATKQDLSIQKISIVDLSTDAVVNAANDGLWAGSGIFGYPVDQAWEVAIRTCRDFLNEGNDIDIVFAVLSDDIMEKGQHCLVRYAAPAGDVQEEDTSKTVNDSVGNIIGFHLTTEPHAAGEASQTEGVMNGKHDC